MDIFSVIMLVCRVTLLSLIGTNYHQEKLFYLSASPGFHPRQLSTMLCAMLLLFVFNYFTYPPSQSFFCGRNKRVCVKM